MKKLSVIVAAYNAEPYIDRCIRSIISQKADTEIVVVDDGSEDRTLEILEKYKDEIKLIALEQNGGSVARTRNIGLENACGEFITYCDADDWYQPGALHKILEAQEKTDADIVRFSYLQIFANGVKWQPKTAFQTGFVPKERFCESVYPLFIGGIDLNSVCCAIFRREIVEHIRFSLAFQTAEDAAFSIEAYTGANSVLFLNEPLYCYYCRSDGLTGAGLSVIKKYKCNFYLMQKTLRFLPQWGMDTSVWRIRTMLRPFKITVDKIRRQRKSVKDKI